MTADEIKSRIAPGEIRFTASRSGGPGGQNVNKVNSRVELRFNVMESDSLTQDEKIMITAKLKNKINAAGELLIVSQSERTQLMNRRKAEEKFYKLIAKALTEKRKRKKTVPTKASQEKRLETKKLRSKTKELRRKDIT
ncbi:MAG TPA: alternative ribosome rescue aminoacyl-tRNA hydrolase ArfB [Bacteroidales bacterium]|nr:alternative ribosome rescue aminoacyl-tRNA hydrolase ArfB [Bacteroidales bacterium]